MNYRQLRTWLNTNKPQPVGPTDSSGKKLRLPPQGGFVGNGGAGGFAPAPVAPEGVPAAGAPPGFGAPAPVPATDPVVFGGFSGFPPFGQKQLHALQSKDLLTTMQVRYGDIELIQDSESGGDDVAFQTFKGRIRIDGNTTGAAGAKAKISSNPIEAISNDYYASWAKVKESDRIINFDNRDDYALMTFNPEQFWSKDKSLNYLKADIAFGGAIAWETDNYQSAGQSRRGQFTNDFLAYLTSGSSAFARSLILPFNYQNFFGGWLGDNKRDPASEWVKSLSSSLKAGYDNITGNAVSAVKGLIMQRLWDGISDANGWDQVVGVHLFILIPTTQEFYNQLNYVKERSSALKDIFPNGDLLANYKWYANPNLMVKPALDITFGFIPNSNPNTAESNQDPFVHPMGHLRSLEWRGGWPLGPSYGDVYWANQLPEITAQSF